MTFEDATKMIQERAERISKSPLFQQAVLDRRLTKKEDVLAFCHQVAIATLYGNGMQK